MVDSFLRCFACQGKSGVLKFVQFCKKIAGNADFFNFLKWPLCQVMKQFKANGTSLMSDFHRASPKMAWLRLCRITNESTETEN